MQRNSPVFYALIGDRRRMIMTWLAVLTLPAGTTFKAGVEAAKAFDDDKQNPTCEWARAPGGRTNEWCFLKCKHHKDCSRMLRVKKTMSTGVVTVSTKEGSIHSKEVATHDRKNATLSKAEKSEMRQALKYGGTPKDVVVELADEAVQAKTAKKKPEGGLEGAGAHGMHKRLGCIHVHSRCMIAHSHTCTSTCISNTLRRIITHSLEPHSHAFACIRMDDGACKLRAHANVFGSIRAALHYGAASFISVHSSSSTFERITTHVVSNVSRRIRSA